MKPPDQVPEGLSAQEYQRLVALYTLMGRHTHATRALSYLSQLRSGRGQAGEKEKEGEQAGAEFASALMQYLKQISHEEDGEEESGGDAASEASKPGKEDSSARHRNVSGGAAGKELEDGKAGGLSRNEEDDPIYSMKEQLMSIGLTAEEAEEYLVKLKKALQEMTKPEPPPREVPEDLGAREYWELALRYKQVGWTEQARDALIMAIEIDGDGVVGRKAQCFLRSKIPKFPVPLMAEQMNIQGYNQMFTNEKEAKKTFKELVNQYPDFEWPYGNLGSLLIKEGDLGAAEEVLKQAVVINPYYINAWLHLSRVYAIESRYSEADECLERVLAIDPADPNWPGIRELVDQLKFDRFN